MASSRLIALAQTILDNASQLDSYFKENKLPEPSFHEHFPPDLTLDGPMTAVRASAVGATLELHDLLVGPAMCLRPVLNATSLHVIYKYKMAEKVPLDGELSFTDLAAACDLEEVDVRRVVRFASAYHRVFQEKKPGFVSHSAASRYLAESDEARAALGFMFDECYQSFAHTVEALEKNKKPSPDQSGWAIASKADVPMWTYHGAHPELGQRSQKAMAAFTKGFNHDVSSVVSGYDWSSVNTKSGVLVDLGGANGHAAAVIARANPKMTCVVQELPEVLAKADYQIPQDVADRVTFQAHDFFQPQPVKADVYFLRQIFHNWGDEYCIKILQALIPVLQPGAKILVNDGLVPPPGVLPALQERGIRAMDMIMMSLFNAREREAKDWIGLFGNADSRFRDVRVWKPEGSHLALIEATWSG